MTSESATNRYSSKASCIDGQTDAWDNSIAFLQRPKGSVLTADELKSMLAEQWIVEKQSDSAASQRRLGETSPPQDPYSMEKLAYTLLEHDCRHASAAAGVFWLRRASDLGNAVAMLQLAELLLETDPKGASVEAFDLYHRAISAGYRSAKVYLAARLLTGDGLPANVREGWRLLTDAAAQGSQFAHFRLAAFLIDGTWIEKDISAGLAWLRRAGVFSPEGISDAGLYLYFKSRRLWRNSTSSLAIESAALFREAANSGHDSARVNLAYLIRRGEVPAVGFDSVQELLHDALAAGDPIALTNEALRLAQGVQCEPDFPSADELISTLRETYPVMSWWLPRSKEGDPEGRFVVAWLRRHGLIENCEAYGDTLSSVVPDTVEWPNTDPASAKAS
jgi:TPR repeat protein